MIKEKSTFCPIVSTKIGTCLARYLPFSAIVYTIFSLLVAIAAVFYAYEQAYILTIFLFLFANFLDIADGAVARAQNKASHLGAFLDGTTDRFIDFAMIYSYFFFPIELPFLDIGQIIAIISFVVIMPTFIVAYANHRRAVDDDNETLIWRLMNRAEMSIVMLAALVVSLFSPKWSGYILVGLIVLASLTIIQTIAETIYYAKKR